MRVSPAFTITIVNSERGKTILMLSALAALYATVAWIISVFVTVSAIGNRTRVAAAAITYLSSGASWLFIASFLLAVLALGPVVLARYRGGTDRAQRPLAESQTTS